MRLLSKRSHLSSDSFSLCSKLNSFMFCPQCKAEYRFGFTHCPDCDVDLVENFPELNHGSTTELSDESLKEVWLGDNEGECISICERFREAEIPFKVNQTHQQVFKHLDSNFRIGVLPAFYHRAAEIIAKDSADQEEEQLAMGATCRG